MKKITEYNFPNDLKSMSINDMEILSYEIREFLIEHISKTGGHLASNLGIVELTLALYKAFDFPKDKVIWDVGHQAYVHKILSGRASEFDTLRKFDGLSGFPKASESEFDVFDTGHASNSISAAAGICAGRDLAGEDYNVISVIGDGSLGGGMAYEALNNVGDSHTKMIVVLNDNGMSISPNIGGMSKHLSKIRTSSEYLGMKNFAKKMAEKSELKAKFVNGVAGVKNNLKYLIMKNDGVLFEELGFTYIGPIDGHNIKDILTGLEQAKSLNEPVLLHVITTKGKGYKKAETNPGKFHGIGPFDISSGDEIGKSLLPTYSEIAGNTLLKLADKNDKVVAITAAMSEATGTAIMQKKYPNRVFDVGIAEEHAVTFAAGLAKAGYKPFVAIYSTFLQRAYDQIIEDVAMQNLPVTFLIDRAGIVGADGETHQGVFDLSYLTSIPNLKVLAPRCAEDLKSMMEYAESESTPVAIRYPRGSAVEGKEASLANVRIGGEAPIELWACGKMVDTAHKVNKLLKEQGIDSSVIEVTSIKPLDISTHSKSSKYVFTIEDNVLAGGFGSQIATALSGAEAKVISFGWPDKFIEHGSFDQLADKYGLTPEKICERILTEIEG